MRLRTSLSLLPLLTAALVAVPTVSVPTAAADAPVPVAPEVHELAVDGIDETVLARSPEPEDEHPDEHPDEQAASPADEQHTELAPVAVAQELETGTFSAVGVTWLPDPGVDDVAVQVRTRADGQWGAWTEVEVQLGTGSDAASAEAQVARTGSDLLFVGASDAVEVRVDSAGGTPRDVRVSLIDPGSSQADTGTVDGSSAAAPTLLGGALAEAAAPAPAYVSRAGWGADESLRRCTSASAPSLKGGILHTTATSNDYTAAQSPAIMRSMYAYHTKSLKWCDFGYNFLVDKFGTLFEGRAGSVTRHVIGSHTGGFNTGTVGVSMIGHHDLVAPTPAQLRTVERVFAWKLGGAGLDPEGTATYVSGGGSATRYPAGTVVRKPMISGHRDYSPKSCPGNLAYPLLGKIRAATAAIVTDGSTSPALKDATPPPSGPAGSRFVPLAPVRVLDTRMGTGGRTSPLAGGATHDLVLGGRHGIPSDATAVALNLTGTRASASTYLTVWPSGGARPATSVLNLRAGGTSASLVVAGLGARGATTVRSSAGSAHLVADVVGFWTRSTGGRYHPVTPTRLLDTRTAAAGARTAADGETRTVSVGGRGGVPAAASAVVLNVTAVSPSRDGYLKVTPSGVRSSTSSVNFERGQTVANRVVTGLSKSGRVDVTAFRATHVLVDVVGWFAPDGTASGGSTYHAVAPVRLVDSRTGTGTHRSAFSANVTRDVQATGRAGVPAGATAVVVSLTTTAPTAGQGYVSAFADGQRRPGTSDVNTARGQTRSNLAVVQLSSAGRLSLYNNAGTTHVVVDVVGYYTRR